MAEHQRKAKRVVVRLHAAATAHELYVRGPDGETKFGLMNRREAESVAGLFHQRFGSNFETSTTSLFAFFEKYAPFLMQ